MTDTQTEILSAFCDGQIVDPDRLADALADSRARDALVDFARLRAAVASSQPLPASLIRLRPGAEGRVRRPRLWAAIAGAAAMLLLIALTFALLPRTWTANDKSTDGPPPPTRVVRYQPGIDWFTTP
jgi:hypothetical protein